MESKKKIYYKFQSSDEDSESDFESSVSSSHQNESMRRSPPFLYDSQLYPESPPFVFDPDNYPESPPPPLFPDFDQSGEGVGTRRQAAAATRSELSPVLEPKKKTSAKLKAKNLKKPDSPIPKKPDSPKPGPSNQQTDTQIGSPTPGTSTEQQNNEAQVERGSAESPIPETPAMEVPDEESEARLENVDAEESRLVSTNLFEQETEVFENEDFVLLMQKTDHQRQKVKVNFF